LEKAQRTLAQDAERFALTVSFLPLQRLVGFDAITCVA